MSHISPFKRILSLLLVWGMLCGLMAFPSVQAAGGTPDADGSLYSQLSDTNKEAYDAISRQVEELAKNSTDPSAVSFTPTQGSPDGAAIFAFFRDHPEYFWVDSSKLAWTASDDNVYSLCTAVTGESFFFEGFDAATLPGVRQSFDAKVQEIIAGMPSGGDVVAQLRYLNNWMAQHNVYNPLGIGASNYSRCAASGILSNNDPNTAPVCYGYATAFKVLLDAAGIPNAYIEGWAYNQNNWPNGEQHAWNYVQLDNNAWYAIDPTWDDPKLTAGQARFHYFLVGSETETETSLSGREQFGQNHDASAAKSPASQYSLTYPTLSRTASDRVVTTGFELIQGGTSKKYDTLEEALRNAGSGSTVKLWQTATITGALTIPDGVTLDLNGQKASGASSLNAVAVSGDVSPLFTIEAGSQASIVNSGSFTSITTTDSGECIQNDGALNLGTNLKIARGKYMMGGDPLSSPIGGNAPEYTSNAYASLSAASPHLLFVYQVMQPTVSGSGSYQASAGDTVQNLIDQCAGSIPAPTIEYYMPTGTNGKVPSETVGTLSWSVGRSPNDSNRIQPTDPLENGEYLFVATAFGYPVTYAVQVSGVPDSAQQYTVTVQGGSGASGGGTYAENDPVTVTAGTKEGYIFQSWTAQGLTLADATKPEISFAMPANDVTLTANFERDYTIRVTGAALAPKTYDGSAAATVTSVDFGGLLEGEQLNLGTDYTATAVFDSANAGTGKTATVTVTLTGGSYVFAGGAKTASYTLSGQSIGKAAYTGVIALSGQVRANASGQVELPQPPTGASFGVPASAAGSEAVTGLRIAGNTLFYEGGSGIVKDRTYTVTVPVSGGVNYNDYNLTVTLTGSDKQALAIAGVTAQNGSYNGAAQAGYTGKPAAAGYDGAFTVTYSTPDGRAPVNAGTYTVIFAIPDNDPRYVGRIALEFTIAKAPLTVAAPRLSAYAGDSAPALALAYTGLVAGESVTPSAAPVFTVAKADGTGIALADAMKTAGTYTITWSNADSTTFAGAGNYQLTKNAAGTLTVSARPGSGDAPAAMPAPTPVPPAPTATPRPAATARPAATPKPTATPAPAPAGPTQVEASLKDGTAVVALSQEQFARIVDQAAERAKKGQAAPAVELEVTAAQGARALQVTLPGAALDTLAQQEKATLTIASPVARVAFDSQALGAVAQQAEGDLVLVVSPVEAAALNEAQTAAAGAFPVVELTLQCNGAVISDFRQGNATITIPHTLAQGQQAEGVVVWYLDEEGGTTACQTSYDEAAGEVTFVTPHFSRYVIGYDETRLPSQPAVQQPEQPQQDDTSRQSGSLPVLPILGGVLLVVPSVIFGLWRFFRNRYEE